MGAASSLKKSEDFQDFLKKLAEKVNLKDLGSHPGEDQEDFLDCGASLPPLLHSGGLSCLPPAQCSTSRRANRTSLYTLIYHSNMQLASILKHSTGP